jgi:hypothetical protein
LHPEIIVCGLPPRAAHGLVSRLIPRIRAGACHAPGQVVSDLIEGQLFAFRSVHASQHVIRLGFAMAFHRRRGEPFSLSALQLLWPDEHGRLPFEDACDPAVVAQQPRLDLPVPPEELDAFLERFGPRRG